MNSIDAIQKISALMASSYAILDRMRKAGDSGSYSFRAPKNQVRVYTAVASGRKFIMVPNRSGAEYPVFIE